ncbi:MAG: hypothetical protein MPK34_03195 [Gammaproteobacteria bacterium]|nr:hypothetical protein [Gammaproteobacteria bacterium]
MKHRKTAAAQAALGMLLALCCAIAAAPAAAQNDFERFIGAYRGSAQVDGARRDMSVRIRAMEGGFEVNWKSVSHKSGGRLKEKEYTIGFRPTGRAGIYSSAMGVNVFGNPVPLDPMKGDPYVWSRISGNTLTVFSLLIDDDGGYEMQQYNRALADGGLRLEYRRIRNGEKLKDIRVFLEKQ